MEGTRDTGIFVILYIYAVKCQYSSIMQNTSKNYGFAKSSLCLSSRVFGSIPFCPFGNITDVLQENQITFVHDRANPHIPQTWSFRVVSFLLVAPPLFQAGNLGIISLLSNPVSSQVCYLFPSSEMLL